KSSGQSVLDKLRAQNARPLPDQYQPTSFAQEALKRVPVIGQQVLGAQGDFVKSLGKTALSLVPQLAGGIPYAAYSTGKQALEQLQQHNQPTLEDAAGTVGIDV